MRPFCRELRNTADQIRAGDLLIGHLACQPGAMGCESVFHRDAAGTLGAVLDTVTALASYTDAQGTHDVSYPVAPGSTLPVVANANGEVVLKLTFWRPQRRAVPEEVAAGASQWIDVGGMDYSAGNPPCPASAYSEIDPSLTAIVRDHPPGSGVPPTLVLADSTHDQPADPHNTFSYTLNLSQCLGAHGWRPGGTTGLPVQFTGLDLGQRRLRLSLLLAAALGRSCSRAALARSRRSPQAAAQMGALQFSRPVFPSPGAPGQNRNPLGFPRASHPADQEPDNARRGGDRPPSTNLELHAQHHISRSSNRAFTHYVRPRVAPPGAAVSWSAL